MRLFILNKGLWGPVSHFPILMYKRAYKKDGDSLFSRVCCNRARADGFRLKQMRFRLDTGKKLFAVRVVRHWHRMPRELIEAPCNGKIPGQAEWRSEQPDLIEEATAQCRRVGPDDL